MLVYSILLDLWCGVSAGRTSRRAAVADEKLLLRVDVRMTRFKGLPSAEIPSRCLWQGGLLMSQELLVDKGFSDKCHGECHVTNSGHAEFSESSKGYIRAAIIPGLARVTAHT